MEFAVNLAIIFADQLMSFIINMLVARHAGEELFGDFNVATNCLFLLSTLITLGSDSIIAYYIPKFYIHFQYRKIVGLIESMRHFLKPIYLTLLGAGLLIAVILLAISKLKTNANLFDISHPIFLFLWGVVILSLYNIYIQYFRAIDYMRTAVFMSFLQTIIYFILSLIIYFYIYPLFFHDDRRYFPHLMLIGFILSFTLIDLLSFAIIRQTKIRQYRNRAAPIYFPWKNKIFGYTIQNLNRYVFSAIPLIVIEWLGHDEHSVGLFSAVVSIINLALIGIGPVSVLMGPEISAAFAKSKQELKRVVMKYVWICVVIGLTVTLVMGVGAKYILLLYKSNFLAALPYTYACLVNILLFSIGLPITRMIQYSQAGSNVGARITIDFLLLQLIASIILIHWFNLLGAIICYVGANILYNVVIIKLGIKIYKTERYGAL